MHTVSLDIGARDKPRMGVNLFCKVPMLHVHDHNSVSSWEFIIEVIPGIYSCTRRDKIMLIKERTLFIDKLSLFMYASGITSPQTSTHNADKNYIAFCKHHFLHHVIAYNIHLFLCKRVVVSEVCPLYVNLVLCVQNRHIEHFHGVCGHRSIRQKLK